MKKTITISFEINVIIKWKCPHCGAEHETLFSASPYSSIAEDPPDEMCKKCQEFVTLNFYKNEE